MIGSILVGLTESLGMTAQTIGMHALGATGNSLLGPLSEIAGYAGGAAISSHLPNMDNAVQLWLQGHVNRQQLRGLCRVNNVNMGMGAANEVSPSARVWEKYLVGQLKLPDIAQGRNLRNRGLIDAAQLDRIVNQQGWAQYALKDYVREPKLPLDIGANMEAGKRGIKNRQWVEGRLWVAGITDPDDQQTAEWLTQSFPALNQVIGWTGQGLYDANFVAVWNLDQGIGPWITTVAGRDGWGWKPSDLWANVPPDVDLPFSLLHWREHWRIVDVGTAGELLRRFQPDQNNPANSIQPGVKPFTQNHFASACLHSGYTPEQTQWLLAAQYQLIGRRELKPIYLAGQLTRAEVRAKLLQQGYSPADADLVVSTWDVELWQRLMGPARAKMKSCVLDAFDVGTITADDATIQLYRLTLLSAASLASYDALDRQSQLAEASAAGPATVEVNAVRACVTANNAKVSLRAIKRLYMLGVLSNQQLIAQLVSAGLVSDRVDQYIALWNLERATWRKWPSAEQLIGYYKRGLMSAPVLSARLTAIGFNSGDVGLMIANANQDIELQLAKAAQAAARSQAQEQRALAAQVRAAKRAQQEAQQQLIKSAGVSTLLTLAKKGLISAAQAETELVKRGIEEPWARLRVRDAMGEQYPSPIPAAQQEPGIQEQLRRDATPSQILRLLKDGLIDQKLALTELVARQIDPMWAQKRIDEALAPPKPKGPKPNAPPAQ